MKVFIPKDIKGGFLNINLQVGPITISIIQLFLVAMGLGLGLTIFNALTKRGVDKLIAAIFAIPVVLIFVVIAFFKYSELSLIPFIAKIIKTYFLDTTKKFQEDFTKVDPIQMEIKKSQEDTKNDEIMEQKEKELDHTKLEKMNKDSFV